LKCISVNWNLLIFHYGAVFPSMITGVKVSHITAEVTEMVIPED